MGCEVVMYGDIDNPNNYEIRDTSDMTVACDTCNTYMYI